MVATTEEVLELHGRVRACTSCPLHLTRIQAVPGYGPVTARVMAVGEAPGESEDREGKPFVGAAGRLLTSLLESVGLDRRDIYITNIVKCRPPRNRDPEPAEVEACSPFLDEQIALLQPDVILLLGRHALVRLLPDRADSEASWTIDMDERKRTATTEARPFKEQATRQSQQAAQYTERVKELKKARLQDEQALAAAEEQVRVLTKEAREAVLFCRRCLLEDRGTPQPPPRSGAACQHVH